MRGDALAALGRGDEAVRSYRRSDSEYAMYAAAIEALNGNDMGGRPLTVNEARPRTERRFGGR